MRSPEPEAGTPPLPATTLGAPPPQRTLTGQRLQQRRAEHEALLTRERRIEQRIATTGVTVLLAWLAALAVSGERLLGLDFWETLLAGLALLAILIGWRQRWTRRRERRERAIEWLERARRRLDEDRFDFGQDDGKAYVDPRHPFSSDLGIFGPGSLYERLNSCHTILGRDALAEMLRGEWSGPTPAERQRAVIELRDALELREAFELELEELAAIGPHNVRERVLLERRTKALRDWGREPAAGEALRPGPVTCRILAGVAVTALVTCAVLGLPLSLVVPFYALNAMVLWRAKPVAAMLERFELVRDTLGAWIRVLRMIESMQFDDPLLGSLRDALVTEGTVASVATRRLKRLTDQLSQRRNAIWAASVDVFLLWDLRVCRALEIWRKSNGKPLRDWLDCAARLEALSALAGYAQAVPESVWARIDPDGPALSATDLTHPLLPRVERVGNAVSLDEPGQLWIVTGSNMSGKSTYLRAAGLAALMSQVGLPVCAKSLCLRPLQIVTCMQVEDSLQEASSLFHAEVRRLKLCLDRAGAPPADGPQTTLVLLDEILAGTNSRERHLGALAILRLLLRHSTVCLVSTHDLGLTRIAEEMPDRSRVVHFRDQVQEGRMSFDYVLRPGPLPSTNALRVMRLVGIDLPEEIDG